MGLRLGEGIARAAFHAETGQDFETALDAVRLASLREAGFLSSTIPVCARPLPGASGSTPCWARCSLRSLNSGTLLTADR